MVDSNPADINRYNKCWLVHTSSIQTFQPMLPKEKLFVLKHLHSHGFYRVGGTRGGKNGKRKAFSMSILRRM